jgi:hypothetical protein
MITVILTNNHMVVRGGPDQQRRYKLFNSIGRVTAICGRFICMRGNMEWRIDQYLERQIPCIAGASAVVRLLVTLR